MLPFSRSDLEKYFPPSVWERAEELVAQGALVEVHLERDGRSISGRVRGERRLPYHTRVNIANGRGGRIRLSSTCTCPVYDCEHAAALLLGVLERAAAPTGEDVTATIDQELEHWIRQLTHTVRNLRSQSGSGHERILYILEPAQRSWGEVGHAQPISVQLVRARHLGEHVYRRETPISLASLSEGDPPPFATLDDLVIARMLGNGSAGSRRLAGAVDAEALKRMIATGRCFWYQARGRPLVLGPVRKGRFRWRFDDQGRQRLECRLEGEDSALVLALGEPWYLDPDSGACGPIDTEVPAPVASLLLRAPRVAPEAATVARQKLVGLGSWVPLPEPLRKRERVEVRPVPQLHLYVVELRVERGMGWRKEVEHVPVPLARLSFDYMGVTVGWQDGRNDIHHVVDNRLLIIARDTEFENAVLERLNECGLQPLGPAGLGRFADESQRQDFTFDEDEEQDVSLRWVEFDHLEVPRLEAEGWRITYSEDYPYRVARPDPHWRAEIIETGSDWFDFDLSVEVEGERIPLLPILLDLFARDPEIMSPATLEELGDEPLYGLLPDGRFLPVPASRVKGIVEALYDLFASRKIDRRGRVRLTRAQVGRLGIMRRELAEDALRWQGGEALRRLADRLGRISQIPDITPPKSLQATLRPYQKQGVAWLQFLADCHLSGVLADDMGLGKTVQTLAHILLEKEQGRLGHPALVVAPTSLIPTWRNELRRFAPSLRLLVLHGQHRQQLFPRIPESDVVLTSYTLLLRDAEVLLPHRWRLVVLDEAQAIKNPSTKLARTACQLQAEQRLALTGTPMENHLGELWSVFHFLMPGFLGDRESFRRVFRNPIEKEGDQQRQALLAARVAPFLLRRTKEQVATELPPKSEVLREIELNEEQRELYESVRMAVHEQVREEIRRRGLAQSSIAILEALLKLRQVCCDPRLLKDLRGTPPPSAKFELLMGMLEGMVETGRRIIVFSQFVEMLELIEAGLKRRHLPYAMLTGRTRDREKPVARFQKGEVPIFLISLKAGGTGLTLTAADTVIHYDPWWNPAVEAQATDRAHRIGQDKTVFVYKLIASGTVEERMLELQQRKKQLVAGVLSGARGGLALSEEDIEALFAPLPEE